MLQSFAITAGTGKSHTLLAFGVAAVETGHRVRYFTAAELVETLYRALADNSLSHIIDTLLCNELIIVDLCRARDYAEGSIRSTV
jgi:DNA replication protein DnaC